MKKSNLFKYIAKKVSTYLTPLKYNSGEFNTSDYTGLSQNLEDSISAYNIWYRGDENELLLYYQYVGDYTASEFGTNTNWFWCKVGSSTSFRKMHVDVPRSLTHALVNCMFNNGLNYLHEKSEQIEDHLTTINFEATLYESAIMCSVEGSTYLKLDIENNTAAFKVVSVVNIGFDNLENKQHPSISFFFMHVDFSGRKNVIIIETRFYDSALKSCVVKYEGYEIINPDKPVRENRKLSKSEIEKKGFVDTEIKTESAHVFVVKINNTAAVKRIESSNENAMLNIGVSDYEGKITEFDALDEIASHMIDDLRKSKPRRFIPSLLLKRDKGIRKFDEFEGTYVTTNYDPAVNAKNVITSIDGSYAESKYLSLYNHLLTTLIQSSGLSPYDMGMQLSGVDGKDLSNYRSKYTERTRNMRLNLWLPKINEVLKNYGEMLRLMKDKNGVLFDDKLLVTRTPYYKETAAELSAIWLPIFQAGAVSSFDLIKNIFNETFSDEEIEAMIEKKQTESKEAFKTQAEAFAPVSIDDDKEENDESKD